MKKCFPHIESFHCTELQYVENFPCVLSMLVHQVCKDQEHIKSDIFFSWTYCTVRTCTQKGREGKDEGGRKEQKEARLSLSLLLTHCNHSRLGDLCTTVDSAYTQEHQNKLITGVLLKPKHLTGLLFPTNNALLINFRLSSDTEIWLISTE